MRHVKLADIIFAKISTGGTTTGYHHETHCYASCHNQGVANQKRAAPHARTLC